VQFLLDPDRQAIAAGEASWPVPDRPFELKRELLRVGGLVVVVGGVMAASLALTPPAPGTRVDARMVMFFGLLFLLYILALLHKRYTRQQSAYDRAVALRDARVLPGRVVEARHIHNVVWTGDTALLVDYEFTTPEGENVRSRAVQLGSRDLPPAQAQLAVLYGNRTHFEVL